MLSYIRTYTYFICPSHRRRKVQAVPTRNKKKRQGRGESCEGCTYDKVRSGKCFLHYWPFVMEIHLSTCHCKIILSFDVSLMLPWTGCCTSCWVVGDLRRHDIHVRDATVNDSHKTHFRFPVELCRDFINSANCVIIMKVLLDLVLTNRLSFCVCLNIFNGGINRDVLTQHSYAYASHSCFVVCFDHGISPVDDQPLW